MALPAEIGQCHFVLQKNVNYFPVKMFYVMIYLLYVPDVTSGNPVL